VNILLHDVFLIYVLLLKAYKGHAKFLLAFAIQNVFLKLCKCISAIKKTLSCTECGPPLGCKPKEGKTTNDIWNTTPNVASWLLPMFVAPRNNKGHHVEVPSNIVLKKLTPH